MSHDPLGRSGALGFHAEVGRTSASQRALSQGRGPQLKALPSDQNTSILDIKILGVLWLRPVVSVATKTSRNALEKKQHQVEMQPYRHGLGSLLAIQIDAAINPGLDDCSACLCNWTPSVSLGFSATSNPSKSKHMKTHPNPPRPRKRPQNLRRAFAGNSGGPALDAQGRCVGVAFQSLQDADNIGGGGGLFP